jgi:UDP-N-acetyl-2-amino-2-deoxyglucuronate dehydrogenase
MSGSKPVVKVRFAVAGCGGMGRWHARVLGTLPGVTLVGGADPDAAARKAFARAAGAPVHDSLGALLAAEPADVVCVCTPPAHHLDAVEAAAAAGRHVLVEKPLAVSVAEADLAIAACARSAVLLGVVHQQRARSAARLVHGLLESGRLGEPELAVATHTWYRTAEQLRSDAWRADALSGGGVLADQAIHTIDLLVWMLGMPSWVSGHVGPRRRAEGDGGGGEDTAVALLGFASGLVATLAATTAANAMRDDMALELYGSRGSVRLEIRDYDHAEIPWLDLSGDASGGRARRLAPAAVEEMIRAEHGGWRAGPAALPWRWLARIAGGGRGEHPFRSPRAFLMRRLDRQAQAETGEAQGHAAILLQMAEAVRHGGQPLVTGEDARRGLVIIEALRRAQQQGGARIEIGTA